MQVSFVGTSGTLSHTATIQLTVNAVAPAGPDFAITATPDTVTVAQGAQSGEVQVGVTGSGGFSGDVTFSVSGLPAGVTRDTAERHAPGGWMEPIVFVADANVATRHHDGDDYRNFGCADAYGDRGADGGHSAASGLHRRGALTDERDDHGGLDWHSFRDGNGDARLYGNHQCVAAESADWCYGKLRRRRL